MDQFQNNDQKNSIDTEDVLLSAEERQKKIRDALLKLDPESPELCKKLAGIYEGLVITFNNKRNPDRVGQVSHSARELTAILPRYFKGIPVPVKEEPAHLENGGGQKQMLEDLLSRHADRSALPEYLRKKFVEDWIEVQTFFHKGSKHDDLKNKQIAGILEKEFEAMVWRYEDLLCQVLVETPFFDGVTEIDKLLVVTNPTPEHLSILAKVIVQPQHRRYFFERCDSQNWLEPLRDMGAFNTPQEPLREGGYIRFVGWPESQYLLKVVEHKAQVVFDIVKNLNSDNQSVLDDFVSMALKSPADIAAKYVDLICKNKWIQNSYNLLLPDKVAELMEKLAKEGRVKEALRLATVLLDTKVDKPVAVDDEEGSMRFIRHDAKPYFDEWRFGEIIKEKTTELAKVDPKGLFAVLASKLRQALELEDRTDKSDDTYYEYSHIWRPNLRSSRHSRDDAKDTLLDGVIRLIEENKDNDELLKDFVTILKSHPGALFRRIELLVYTLNPKPFSKEIEEILTNKKVIISYNLRREYLPLLNTQFGNLSSPAKDSVLKIIEEGPDFKKNENFTQEEFERVKSDWKGLYLKAIKDHLPAKEAINYQGIVKQYGEPTDHDGEMVMWDGGKSPISSEELSKLNAEDTLQYFVDYKTPDDPFGRHSTGGLGMIFAELVAQDPEKFVVVLGLFFEKKIRPIFFYHLIHGLKESLKKDKCFVWEEIVELLYRVVVKGETDVKPASDEQDWKSVRLAIADFLGEALGKDKCEVPISLQDKVWEIIANLAEDPDPTPEYEKRDGEGGLDPMTLAINTIRGEAMHAVVNFGLWTARNLPDKTVENKMTPAMLELLDKHLDYAHDPALAIRSVYGWRVLNFSYLNCSWLEENKHKIFDKSSPEHLWAAWEGYLANNVIKEVFTILKEQYRDFVPYLGTAEKRGFRAADVDQRFAQHAAIVYTNEPDHDDFSEYFFKAAPPQQRSEAINFIGRVILRQLESFDDKEKVKGRLRNLWDARISQSKENIDVEEIREFGWWFKVSPFPKNETLDRTIKTLQLIDGIIDVPYEIAEELKFYALEFPVESITVLNLIARAERETYEYLYKKEAYREVIKIVKSTNDEKAIEIANGLINYFGSIGLIEEFRDLL